ncbi:hypothetical protein SAMN05421819_2161 [Bryocella elongata]|uniref:Haemolysin XhlA n=1 Tax=Bryocella elongata TaxID=863522 RepID=A0A1H5Y7G7_9BACT|nr:hypothetical protein [Bryocella elongata]SEG19943.1 hypothetical protein SAMN05421819_2161 [Bryocella elongata]
MTEFEAQVLRDLSALKAQMDQLLGIGQPGRLHEIEERVASHERSVQRLKGMMGALGVLLTVAHVVVTWFAERR